jgi:hypothetical protein
MAFADKLRELGNKAKNLAQGHPDQANRAVEKAGDEVGRRTGGKFDTQIDSAEDKADEVLGIDKDDRQPAAPTAQTRRRTGPATASSNRQ